MNTTVKQLSKITLADLAIQPFLEVNSAADSFYNTSGKIKTGFAVAINAEKLVTCYQDPAYKQLISTSTVAFADGIPVVWLMSRKGKAGKRIPGCELWESLMQKAGVHQSFVYLLGASERVNALTQIKLQQQYHVNIVGAHSGYFDDNGLIIEQITKSRAQIVCVAMGSPKQEKFIAECREKYPNTLYIGVGGSYDVFVDEVKRAPRWMQRIHLEWLFRLVVQPTRISRQLRLLQFIGLFIRGKF